MKLYDEMTDDERSEFLRMSATMMKEIRDETAAEREIRPALIMLWAMGHERSVVNLWAHYDIDPNGFVDDAVRLGSRYLENLIRAIEILPPPEHILPGTLAQQIARMHEVIGVMRSLNYRALVIAVFDDFFCDQRAEGNL